MLCRLGTTRSIVQWTCPSTRSHLMKSYSSRIKIEKWWDVKALRCCTDCMPELCHAHKTKAQTPTSWHHILKHLTWLLVTEVCWCDDPLRKLVTKNLKVYRCLLIISIILNVSHIHHAELPDDIWLISTLIFPSDDIIGPAWRSCRRLKFLVRDYTWTCKWSPGSVGTWNSLNSTSIEVLSMPIFVFSIRRTSWSGLAMGQNNTTHKLANVIQSITLSVTWYTWIISWWDHLWKQEFVCTQDKYNMTEFYYVLDS